MSNFVNQMLIATLRLALLLSVGQLLGCAAPPPVPAPPPVATSAPAAVISIDQTARGVLIPLPNSVLFNFGKADLNTVDAQPYLEKIARLISTKSNKLVAIEGHSDNVGTLEANQALSESRAKAVRDVLLSLGVPAQRLKAEGFAYLRPLVSNSNEEGRAQNRRVEIMILDEKLETITAGEPASGFQSAFSKLKAMVDQGLVKPL